MIDIKGVNALAEGNMHKNLKKHARFFLKEKVTDIVANEVKFRNIKCIADTVGINLKRKEIRIIEAKATREDFLRDKKLFSENHSYFYHAHFSYIICPSHLLQAHEMPYGYGLLWVNDIGEVSVVKKPLKNKEKLKTRFDTILKRTVRRLSNELLYSS